MIWRFTAHVGEVAIGVYGQNPMDAVDRGDAIFQCDKLIAELNMGNLGAICALHVIGHHIAGLLEPPQTYQGQIVVGHRAVVDEAELTAKVDTGRHRVAIAIDNRGIERETAACQAQHVGGVGAIRMR